MALILYYFLIKPISLLPFRLLYVFSDILYFLLYKVAKYRTKVVKSNIEYVFGDKSETFRQEIVDGFYRHLCDVIVEGIKGFSLSNKTLLKRYKIVNPELLDKHFDKGESVLISAGHFGNWEWATMAASLYFKHICVGIYTPLSSKFFEQKMKQSRGKNGLVLIGKREVNEYFHTEHSIPQLYFFLIDQSPSNPEKAYWSTFLGKDTPIQFGLEKYAKAFNMPVYFLNTQRMRRGYYELTLHLVENHPSELPYGKVLEESYKLLEQMILSRPEWWLWSHKRWKHKRKN